MIGKLSLLAVTALSACVSLASASMIKQRQQEQPRDVVLYDIKANSHPPKYRNCTADKVGHRKLRYAIQSIAMNCAFSERRQFN